jgi:hypothetical protein
MAQTGKEKQARHRARMRSAGYKLVQVWVKDKEGEELKRYVKELEAGVRSPKTSLRWDCERVILEIHKKSRDMASRDRRVFSFMEDLFGKVREGYEAKKIPWYVYLDIVELLRPLLGEDMYREHKAWYEIEKVRAHNRVYNALLVEMYQSVFPEWSESDDVPLEGTMLDEIF